MKVAIVGHGRFGKTLERLIKDDFDLIILRRKDDPSLIKNADVIFYCVPISLFEGVVKSHLKHLNEKQLVIDVLSVKVHPKRVLERCLKNTEIQAILTHPMFGPDSSKAGFEGLPIMLNRFRADKDKYSFWKNYFSKKGLKVVEMTPEDHDKLAASSQGLTHFVGRVLEEYGLKSTPIDTLGAKKLLEVMDQTCNDNVRLFRDLQTYNPYTKKMRIRLGASYENIYERLLPKRVDQKQVVIGVQGGKGSFNEEAANHIAKERGIIKYKIKYLYTTDRVLKKLHEGDIDYGVFAIQNAVGGMVTESAYAMAKYKFRIVEEFAIRIRHFLMKRKDVSISDIKSVMAHPQVFRQCKKTMPQKYPLLKLISGKGDMIDTARAAQALSKGEIPKSTVILGPRRLSEIYGLDIVDADLQDDKEGNFTSFFFVKR